MELNVTCSKKTKPSDLVMGTKRQETNCRCGKGK